MCLSFTIAAGPRQLSHSRVWVSWNSWLYFTVSDSRLPQPGVPGARIDNPQEQGGPVIPPDTRIPFHSLLWLTGLGWRYSNPPPEAPTDSELLVFVKQPQHGPHRKRVFHYCVFSRCRGNSVSNELFPSNGCCTVDCSHSCHLAMTLHVRAIAQLRGRW
jgi:hypothetical protein